MLSAASPFSFVLFGASGHLAKLKIYPALFILFLKDRLPEQFNLVGYARSEMSDEEFRTLIADSIKTDMKEVNEEKLQAFLEHTHYVQGQYDATEDFRHLAEQLQTWEEGWERPVRLAYLSVPPTVFAAVSENLKSGGVHNDNVDMRIIVEKPVGHDLKSFETIRSQLLASFTDEEIYLLDHWLGKEAVRNIYYLRFANPVLERLFKNTLIHHVEITAAESVGIENRAGYFEHTGTFRDMFQSHLLMALSLLTMRTRYEDDDFRLSRKNALEQLYLPPAGDMEDIVLQGQYTKGELSGKEAKGYTQEDDVDQDSRTNTYAAMRLMTRTSRWQGVPFYLRSGKRLRQKETRISLQFQEPHPVGEGSSPNRLDIILQGEAGLRLHLQTKLGGTEPIFRPLVMEDPLVCFGDCLPEHGMLLLEAIHGKRQWFLTFEEVQLSWRLIDPVQTYLDRKDTPLHAYPAGTDGPPEAQTWIERDGLQWFPL